MSATSGRDNPRELKVRSVLHRRGYRFRIHYKISELPRRSIDIAFPALRLAVFLDGCFWHGCPQHRSFSKTNTAYWSKKILENQFRDSDTDRQLGNAGWSVLRIWEHVPIEQAIESVADAIQRRIT